MALKASIYKVNLSVANLNQHHYQNYRLTLARHPSETENRLLVRLAGFALFSNEEPEFTKGLSTDDEPDLWVHNLTGEITHWIELGQPSDKRIRQACSKAAKVTILGYNQIKFNQWQESLDPKTRSLDKLNLILLSPLGDTQPEQVVQKNMELSCTLQEEQILFTGDSAQMTYEITQL